MIHGNSNNICVMKDVADIFVVDKRIMGDVVDEFAFEKVDKFEA